LQESTPSPIRLETTGMGKTSNNSPIKTDASGELLPPPKYKTGFFESARKAQICFTLRSSSDFFVLNLSIYNTGFSTSGNSSHS